MLPSRGPHTFNSIMEIVMSGNKMEDQKSQNPQSQQQKGQQNQPGQQQNRL